jgi:hypothetical protein
MRRRTALLSIWFLATLLFSLAGGGLAPQSALARSAEYARFDVQLTVLDDGTFRVVETQTVDFTDGPFSQGHRSIPLARISGVENIAVSELIDGDLVPFEESDSGEFDTFEVVRTSTDVDIRWVFPQANDEQRTFVIEYELVGALRYYPQTDPPNQQVWYIPIGESLTAETPVRAGTFTLDFPEPVNPEAVVLTVDGEQITDFSPYTSDYQRFQFEHAAFSSGEGWEIRLQSDVVAVDVEVPAWQEADDNRRAAEEAQANRDTQVAGFAAIGAVAIAIFGGLGILLLWFLRGRDPHTGAVAAFLPEPPDTTPPAIVGVLVDERVHQRDIVSTITHWGQRGIIAIREPGGGVPSIELKEIPAPLSAFEQQMLAILFPAGPGQVISYGQARQALKTHERALEATLYREVEERGYFRRSPDSTRNRWKTIATIITSLSIIGGIAGSMLISSWLVLPAFTITAISIVLRIAARTLPQRTRAGAESAAKWRAFERYLRDLERYDTLDTARSNFDRFLPYAIVFGIESQWIERFNRAGFAPSPTWYDDVDLGDALDRIPGGRGHGGRPVIVTTGGNPVGDGGGFDLPGLPDFNLPDLQDTSRKAAQGIGGASKGSVDLLNVLGAIFEVASIFIGGGKSGGGSGGGGGGFH